MRTRLTVISDTHTGSTVGLAPPEPIPHPEGFTISASRSSQWLWGHYTRHLIEESFEAVNHEKHILIFNGDIMDGGMHHGQIQLYHPEGEVEAWLAFRAVQEAVDVLDPDHIVIVLGTPSHVGQMGKLEETVGKKIEAEYPGKLVRPEHRYGWHIFRMEASGVLVDVRHHGRMGRLPHTRESYQKRYAFDVWSSQAMYGDRVPAQLALRAHNHKWADSGPVPPHRNGTRVLSGPCYQMSTEWAVKMAFEDPPDIGMYGVTLEEGRVKDVFPQIVVPQINEGVVWTP